MIILIMFIKHVKQYVYKEDPKMNKIMAKIRGLFSQRGYLSWEQFSTRVDAISGLNFVHKNTIQSYNNTINKGGLMRPSKFISMGVYNE